MPRKKKVVYGPIPVAPPVEETMVVEEPVKEESIPAPISAYPFRLIERWVSEDGREIRKLEACPYGGNGIAIKTSTRFLDPAGNVTACSEALCTIPGVSMRTFDGNRRGKKEL